jgi:hypothetical protein
MVLVCALAAGSAPSAPAQTLRSAALADVPALLADVIAHQHRNDEALTLYERRELRVLRKKVEAPADEERLFRVVPTGTGTLKLILAENGVAVTSGYYREQLRELERVLLWALDPNESKQRQRVIKGQRRAKERYDTVEAAGQAFLCVPAGRDDAGGRPLLKLACEPNPHFRPATRTTEVFRQTRATIWVDLAAAQLVRVVAELTGDLSIGAGVFGKVYRGSRFEMEQAEVAPGVWLPARFLYTIRGRKFLFGFEQHEAIAATHYRRVGPPAEALAAVREEIRQGGAARAPE